MDIPGIKDEPSAFQGNFVYQQCLKKKKQGLAPGCSEEEVTTVVKKLQDLGDHAFIDSNDKLQGTDLHSREREEKNDSPMRNDDGDDTRESGDNCKNDRKEDDHSAATKVCHDIFTENCHLMSTSIVCYTAVFSVVTQRFSPQTAAENRTTFLFLCVCGVTNKPIMFKRFDNT